MDSNTSSTSLMQRLHPAQQPVKDSRPEWVRRAQESRLPSKSYR